MAIIVIDRLELVDIKPEQRECFALPAAAGQCSCKPLFKMATIGHAGQAVDARQAIKFRLGEFERSDIKCQRKESAHVSIGIVVGNIVALEVVKPVCHHAGLLSMACELSDGPVSSHTRAFLKRSAAEYKGDLTG